MLYYGRAAFGWRDLYEEGKLLYAVFESGGKQHKASEGDVIFLERLAAEVGESVKFEKVLAFSDDGDIKIGEPYLEDAYVEAKVLAHGKDKKIVVFKYKSKKGYRRKQGHRQPYTKVSVEAVRLEGATAFLASQSDVLGADDEDAL